MPDEICPKCNNKHYYVNITGTKKNDFCKTCNEPIVVEYRSAKQTFTHKLNCPDCGIEIEYELVPGKHASRKGCAGNKEALIVFSSTPAQLLGPDVCDCGKNLTTAKRKLKNDLI